mmetsp:Transcript_19001/g.39593  ORF Transcript_19001/g.39593 Transcript_19001/m.39593 type:complete len:173 (+) Transcript_19001:885-1403(+)
MLTTEKPKVHTSHKLWVTGLTWEAREDDVRALFGNSGEIVACELLRTQTGLSSGGALVTMKDKEGAEAMQALDGAEFYNTGRWISVLLTTGYPDPTATRIATGTKSTSVFFANLSDFMEVTVRRVYEDRGCKIKEIIVPKNSMKAYGWIEFMDVGSAEKAVEMNGTTIEGVP